MKADWIKAWKNGVGQPDGTDNQGRPQPASIYL